ncbi:MAG: hypothetical protein ABIT04_01235 [Novosphingobium sp.]
MPAAPHPHRWPAYKRIPAFLPVPVRARDGGWTPATQGEFVGMLAETGSVRAAAAWVGMSREGAYRLRRRAGAEGFALAWDVALGHNAARPKVTADALSRAAFGGLVRVTMRRGRYVGTVLSPCESSLIRLLARFDRLIGGGDGDRFAPAGTPAQFPRSASTARVTPPARPPARNGVAGGALGVR